MLLKRALHSQHRSARTHSHSLARQVLARTAIAVPSLTEFRVWGNPAVCAVGAIDHDAAAVVNEVLTLGNGNIVSDVQPYEVDGLWYLAHNH